MQHSVHAMTSGKMNFTHRCFLFKAPLGDNGLSEIYVRYQPDGTGIYQLPVIVSGSKSNSRNIDAKIAVDEDTLRILNQEKFPVGRQDLWYVPLAEQHYSFESNICHIPAGENIQLYPIHFNFNGLELDEKIRTSADY